MSGGLDKCSHKHVTQEQLQAAFHTPGVCYILTVQNLNLERLYPAYHNPAIVEGQCVLARWHFVGLLPGPDIVQWMSLVTSTLAPGGRELAGGACGPGLFLFAIKKLSWGVFLWVGLWDGSWQSLNRCILLGPLCYHASSPQAAGGACHAFFVFGRSVVVHSCYSDRAFTSVKFHDISISSPARFVTQNSLVTPKRISTSEGPPAHFTAEKWSTVFYTSLGCRLDM